ncbi:hypothetical protein TrRE_jg8614 [Triparma retinervis]|uniref:Methyltransferase type 11 domain-containing protein n=1 Tax=Triparma retinervis TaxID=2557542 RepID=A0A9W7AJG9_9STRA|nr:hypothetical protein TrRE_jg8614 [Triparma retinervis]
MAHYSRLAYWDQRYREEKEPFEWYQNYQAIQVYCQENFLPTNKILNVGAGNSSLSEQMYEDGFRDITNIDISTVVVEQMIERTQSMPGMTWQIMDCRYMEFEDETFDAVVDKGCLDTLLTGEASEDNANKFCSHVARILKPGGVYMCVSVGIPSERMPILGNEDFSWSVEFETLSKPASSEAVVDYDPVEKPTSCHYLYICKTGGDDNEG